MRLRRPLDLAGAVSRLVAAEAAAGRPRSGIAGRLLDLADAARRLPPPDHRQPEVFHQAKDDLAAELRDLAMQVSRTLERNE